MNNILSSLSPGLQGLLAQHKAKPSGRSTSTTVRASSYSADSQQWVATVTSNAAEKEDQAGQKLAIEVVDAANGSVSDPTTVNGNWEKFVAGGGHSGWARKGLLAVPNAFQVPGALLVEKDGKSDKDRDYIGIIKLATQDGEVEVPVSSWLVDGQGKRAFFTGTFLPKDTPPALKDLRKDEIKKMQGPNGPQPLTDASRAYGWQVYDDLGKDRPALGGTKELPYPRHLYNARPTGQSGPGTQWLPLDERFDESKNRGFNGGLLEGIGPAVAGLLPELGLFGDKKFTSYEEVLRFFSSQPSKGGASIDDEDSQTDWDLEVDSVFDDDAALTDDRKKRIFNLLPTIERKKAPSWKDLFKFRAPRVLAGRGVDVLLTDQEWGRQCIAGMNPCTLVALKQLPAAQFGSAIGPEHVEDELKKLGSSKGLAELVAAAAAGGKPRLFVIDYMVLDHFWAQSESQKNRAEHAGRVLLFLQHNEAGNEVALVPIAFELKHRKTAQLEAAAGRTLPEGQGIVYARQELVDNPANPGGEALWSLAKHIFRSADSGFHQLISHWLRCHACMEPFGIALHRQFSTMHPLYKLMLPHFRYTLDINSKARKSLINQGGIIEDCFSPGPHAMSLSAVAYGALWRFHSQALPEDLAARGMLDGEGKLWIQDYPYATDGLELWREMEAYFRAYLALYYKSDEEVLADEELQAWWSDAKDNGHPDMKLVEPDEAKVWGFAGPIPSVEKLTRVLTTIAWTASAHHASVNFGQYDFASLLFNVSSMVRRPIPRPPGKQSLEDRAAYQKLASSKGKAQEAEILTYIADPFHMVQVMVTVKLLSIHADNEQTLDERNTLLTDPPAVALNTQFMERMAALEARVQTRNAATASWTRFNAGGERVEGMPYTLLIPASSEGLTFKGVPYSVSI
ncbi:hypothetical protein ABPG77_006864 [Micractinium sp. CCAP 211/92]